MAFATITVKKEQKIGYWFLIGPLMMVATLVVLMLKEPRFLSWFSFVTLTSILCCATGKKSGLACALAFLSLMTAYLCFYATPAQCLVISLISLSFAIAISITTLAMEEAFALLSCTVETSSIETQEVKELKNQLIEQRHRFHALEEETEQKKSLLSNLSTEKDALNQQVEEQLKLIEQMREVCKNAELRETRLSKELSAAKQKMADTSSLDNLRMEVRRLLEQAQQKEKTISELQSAVQETSSHMAERQVLNEKIDQLNLIAAEKEQAVILWKECDREKRSNEGKLRQLQQQFQEKCHLLDETRYELFHAKERLTHQQLLLKEKSEYSDEDLLIDRHLAKIEKEWQRINDEHSNEIAELHDLIAGLLKEV